MQTINSLTRKPSDAYMGSDYDLLPGRRQAIIWTNAGISLIGPLGANFSEILIEIHAFSFKKMRFEKFVCEMTSLLSRPQVLNDRSIVYP